MELKFLQVDMRLVETDATLEIRVLPVKSRLKLSDEERTLLKRTMYDMTANYPMGWADIYFVVTEWSSPT